jgi:hypothetical protein
MMLPVFNSRRAAARRQLGFHALQNLYRSFLRENSPEIRGQTLLRQWLSREEREFFDSHGYLDVVGCHTGKRYRIYYGILSNVRELNAEGKPVAGLCFVPVNTLPPGDVVLAQKIALETDERGALAVAKRFQSSSCPTSSYSWRRA